MGVGIAFLIPSSACILQDHCILLYWPGANWCSSMEGARKWPAGHPELAVPVLTAELEPPLGCSCVNDTEAAILSETLPGDAYLVLKAEIEAITRQECLTLALGFANNCLQESGPDAPTILAPNSYDDLHGPCVGDCEYFDPPLNKDCPADPNPFACEGLVLGGSNDEADDGGACPIGAEECPCTAGGACDSNLECVDGMCVPLPSDEEVGDDGSDVGLPLECPSGTCELEGGPTHG